MIKFRLMLLVLLLLVGSAVGQTAERYIVVDFNTALAHVFDLGTNSEVAAIKVGTSPSSVVISPNGRLAFVANINATYVSVVDLTIGAEIKRIQIRLAQLAISADGATVVGTDVDDDGITVIDANALTVVQTISYSGKLGDDPALNVFGIPSNPVIVGNKVYLETSFDFGVIDLGTSAVTDLGSAPATNGALDFTASVSAATADGKFVMVNRQGQLLIIDTTTNAVVNSIPLGFVFAVNASRNASDPSKIYGYVLRAAGSTRNFTILDLSAGSASFGTILGDLALPAAFPTDLTAQIGPNSDGTRAVLTTATAKPNIYIVDTSVPSAPALLGPGISVGTTMRGVTVGITQNQPPATAPIVTAVSTPLVTNDAASNLQISGNGFAPDAQVRIGGLDPQAAQFVSSSQLQVTIPADSPAQGAAIIVTNPNLAQGVAGANQSGILSNAFVIASGPTFQPANQVALTNFGDSTFSILNVSTNTTLSPAILAPNRVLGLAVTPDGSRAYIERLVAPAAVDVFNFTTNSFEASIPLNASPVGIPGQNKGIVLAPRFGTGELAAYVSSSVRVGGQFVLNLYVIDADPANPTFNTVVATFPTNPNQSVSNSGGVAVTPDGHFAFVNGVSPGNVAVIDLTTGISTSISTTTLGVSFFQPAPEISPDGKFLVLNADDGSAHVFDITNPTTPALFTTIQGTPPAGFAPLLITPRIIGSTLYGFDQLQNVVAIFNFKPVTNDFAQLGTFAFPGTPTLFAAVPDVTPDGKLMYLPLREENAVAVVDTTKVLAADPSALLTKIGVGIAPDMVAVRPGTPTPAGSNVAVLPIPPVSLTFGNVTAAGATSVATANTNPDPLPAGFSLGTPPVYYEISTTAMFTGLVQVCISYNPAQFVPPESNMRLLHDQGGTFVDVTTSLDTTNHVVCGQVTSFSPFTVGTASVDFFFDSLLAEINAGVADNGTRQSLSAKVQAAKSSTDRQQGGTAQNQLNAFENEVRAQTGKKLDAAEAAKLLQMADAILSRL
jgi:DNA-binding beta-propeller fold protein YncE